MQSFSEVKTFDLYDFHNILDGKVLLSYKGPWDEHILVSIGNYIRSIDKNNPKIGLKIFKIFMELAQNMSLYSAEFSKLDTEKRVGIGSMLIREEDGCYYFYSGNLVKNKDIIPIIDKCDVINSLDRDELREFKRKQRNMPRGEFGGANIGLIQIALTSNHPLDIKVTPITEEDSFFSVCVTIKHP
jgi:hypothetical protein